MHTYKLCISYIDKYIKALINHTVVILKFKSHIKCIIAV